MKYQDPITETRIVRTVVFDYCCNPQYVSVSESIREAQKFLSSEMNITRSFSSLMSVWYKLKKDPAYHTLDTMLQGTVVPRRGKAEVYSVFFNTIARVLKDQSIEYVGLPSNQIGAVIGELNRISPRYTNLTCCESHRPSFLSQKKFLNQAGGNFPGWILSTNDFCHIKRIWGTQTWLINDNIINFLNYCVGEQRFNVIDLDFMDHQIDSRNPRRIKDLVQLINKVAAAPTTVVNISTSIGRNITKQHYSTGRKLLIEELTDNFKKVEVVFPQEKRYRDSIIPIAVDQFVLYPKHSFTIDDSIGIPIEKYNDKQLKGDNHKKVEREKDCVSTISSF